jgi:hypothetical protein
MAAAWLVLVQRPMVETAMANFLSPSRLIAASIALLAMLLAVGWATREDPAERPVLNILGGGFIFNYRVADIYYGFTAVVERPLESGSIIEARFENPAGGEELVVRERVSPMTNRYAFRSPPLRGVEAGRPYKVEVRVLDRLETAELWSTQLDFTSQISDQNMPDKPLTIGPGYAKNPDVGG